VHVATACVGSGKGSDHFGSYVITFPAFLQEAASKTLMWEYDG
jgi:hypothetical protein